MPINRLPAYTSAGFSGSIRLIGAVISVLTMFISGSSLAARVSASVDRNELHLGEQMSLSVTVDGDQDAEEPILPAMPGFSVYGQGSSTQMKIMNGKVSASISYNYVLVPKQAGTFTIDPIQVPVQGQTYRTQPFSVRVLAADAVPSQRKGQGRETFIMTRISNPRPVVGEQVLYTLRVYNRAPLRNASLSSLEFTGFVAESLGEQKTFAATVEGMEYQVTELRWALFPQKAGHLPIASAQLSFEHVVGRRRGRSPMDAFFDSPLDDFFGRVETERGQVQSQSIDVEVSVLPAAPPNFSGLVGHFEVDASLSNLRPHVGESSTLTLTVRGQGNAASIGEPRVRGLETFKIYDDKPVSDIQNTDEGVRGNKIFKKALVPLQAGRVELPAIQIVYFDPSEKIYRTAQSSTLSMEILPALSQEDLKLTEAMSPNSGKVAVRVLADDLLPIYRKLDAIQPVQPRWQFGAFALSLVVPPGLFLGVLWQQRRRKKKIEDAPRLRKSQAFKKAKQALGKIPTEQPGQIAALLSRVLRDYVGNKLNREGTALTPLDVKHTLLEQGIAEPLVIKTQQVLEQCDAAQYGLTERSEAHELLGKKKEILTLMKELDKVL